MRYRFNFETFKTFARVWRGQMGIVAALFVTCAALTLLLPHFIGVANLTNVVRQVSINGILAVGVTLVLLTGGVDLSLGSVVALAGVTAAHLAHPGDYPAAVPLLAGVAAGIPVRGVKALAYTMCGALAGLAGVVLAARITTGQPNAGAGYELDAIAAAVIGGTSLAGGVGSVGGTILGVLLLGVIGNGLDLLNVSSYYQQIVKGVIIVGAVWFDRRKRV